MRAYEVEVSWNMAHPDIETHYRYYKTKKLAEWAMEHSITGFCYIAGIRNVPEYRVITSPQRYSRS